MLGPGVGKLLTRMLTDQETEADTTTLKELTPTEPSPARKRSSSRTADRMAGPERVHSPRASRRAATVPSPPDVRGEAESAASSAFVARFRSRCRPSPDGHRFVGLRSRPPNGRHGEPERQAADESKGREPFASTATRIAAGAAIAAAT